MTDREKLAKRLTSLIKHCTSCEECRDEDISDYLIANGVTIAEMKKPLALEQVKEKRAVWIEDDGCETGQELYPALYDAKGYPHHTVFIYQDEGHAWLDNLLYGITWRCWETRPTEEEMAAAEWEEGATDGA